ncbi:MAG TPA: AAA family ATPase [Solirubrobacteraceae bacterium]|nr:AAA family ATPase [Solirubrobacteraceae bacterium]
MGATQTVSLVFTDLVGSTAHASRLGADSADALRREHFGILRDSIGHCGGEEVKNLGDGVMASFDRVASAVACAIGMQQRIDQRNRQASPPLEVKIGVAVGDAVGEAGDWFGAPVVEAARLCEAAEGGQILVTEAVHLLTAGVDAPSMQPVGPLDLKGLSDSMPAWSVEWERLPLQTGAPPLPPRLRDVPDGEFVGRVAEREQLDAAWAQAREGERRLVLVCGEPGIGKTRLAADLAHEARRGGATVLYGRCDDDAGVPYQPWREALGHLVELGSDELLRQHVEVHGGELARLVPGLQERFDAVPEPQATDPETERYLLFGAAVELLRQASGVTPVLLILDDLHWATRPTLGLLKHLQVAVPSMPLLVVATYREPGGSRTAPLAELLGDLHREPGVERLTLAGFGEREAQSLLETAAGHDLDESGAALARDLHRETGGNPFFLGEMVRHLTESGAIQRDSEGRWIAEAAIATVELPASVHEVITGRVARLGPDAERVLRTAAVIGRDFDVGLLARVSGVSEDEALDVLEEGAAAALVTEVSDRPGGFAFVHALVSHALGDGLTGARRVRLHESIAKALEERLVDDPEARLGELAHHWAAVGDAGAQAKARDYAVRAGWAAVAQLAPDEAVGWFAQALEVHSGLPEPDAATDRELLLALGDAQLQAGVPQFRETLLDVARAAEEADDGDHLVRAALQNSRGYFSSAGSVDAERVAVLEAALDHSVPADPRRASLLALLAAELLWSGDHERRRALSDEAVELARRDGDLGALAHVLTLRVSAVWWPETLTDRLETTAELVELTESGSDPVQQFWALVWRGVTVVQAGDVAAADRCLEALRALTDRLGQPRLRFVLGTQEAWRAQLGGRLDEAERLADAASAIGIEAGEPDALSLYAAQIGSIRWQQGRLNELDELLAQIVQDAPGVAVFGAMHALAELDAGNEQRARSVLERAATDGFAGVPVDQVRLGTLVLWTELATRLGATSAAADLLEQLGPWRDQIVLDSLGTLGSVARALGMLAAQLGRWDEADAHFAHALDAHQRIGAASLEARTTLDWGTALRRGGRRGDDFRSRELLAESAEAAGRLGLPALERRALQTTVAGPPAHGEVP